MQDRDWGMQVLRVFKAGSAGYLILRKSTVLKSHLT